MIIEFISTVFHIQSILNKVRQQNEYVYINYNIYYHKIEY